MPRHRRAVVFAAGGLLSLVVTLDRFDRWRADRANEALREQLCTQAIPDRLLRPIDALSHEKLAGDGKLPLDLEAALAAWAEVDQVSVLFAADDAVWALRGTCVARSTRDQNPTPWAWPSDPTPRCERLQDPRASKIARTVVSPDGRTALFVFSRWRSI